LPDIMEHHADIKQHLLDQKRRAKQERIRNGITDGDGRKPISGLDAHKVAADYLGIPKGKLIIK